MDGLRTFVIVPAIVFGVFSLAYFVWVVFQAKSKAEFTLPQKVAGLVCFVMGVIMSGAWIFLFTSAESQLGTPYSFARFHVLLEMLAALGLLISGFAMVRGWKHAPGLLIGAIALLMFSTWVSVMGAETIGHPLMLNIATVVVTLVISYFVGWVFVWEHFVLHMDQLSKGKLRRRGRHA